MVYQVILLLYEIYEYRTLCEYPPTSSGDANADHSFYSNMAYGHSYYDYILEVYDYVHQIFPLSKKERR